MLSMLDNDFYKFTMLEAILKKYPTAYVKYKLFNRTTFDLSGLVDDLESYIRDMTNLKITSDELAYLESYNFLSPNLIDFLRTFKFNPDLISINKNPFNITIEGPWKQTILYEVPILAGISELIAGKIIGLAPSGLFSRAVDIFEETVVAELRRHRAELNVLNQDFIFSDFGTRKRCHHAVQSYIINELKAFSSFIGTSNVHYARLHGIKAIGTQAHEWFMAHQAFTHPQDSQRLALQTWADVFRGSLGIALTDTLGMRAFLNDFDLYFAKLFDGMRGDSGNLKIWADSAIDHYNSLGISPRTKTLVFSDDVNLTQAIQLWKTFKDSAHIAFGIGGALMYNLGEGFRRPNIVIKMIYCNDRPVAKIPDSSGKTICDSQEYLTYLKKLL